MTTTRLLMLITGAVAAGCTANAINNRRPTNRPNPLCKERGEEQLKEMKQEYGNNCQLSFLKHGFRITCDTPDTHVQHTSIIKSSTGSVSYSCRTRK